MTYSADRIGKRRHMGPVPGIVMTMAVALLPILAASQSQDEPAANSGVVWIGLANGTEAEATMAAELRALIGKYDVEPWILTRSVLIDENQIPHSHPILTIHTRHIGEELELLATFVHEQLHWLDQEPWRADFEAAMQDFEAQFPEAPSAAEGGARDVQSTYRHLLVCDLEYQAMTALVGAATARETLAATRHYQWIYHTVLNDRRVREIALRRGFDVSQQGTPRDQ
ncbi:MAG TPA: hypothetical protein VGA68_09780 [Woeseiaceae bacterium]